ncbi:hypothetical protein NDU88_007439 [Pleurodeles waltl]|uniref:Uncharacterized protein n=1 Tax=Pleurodeles waltl TaxID=8319 RepID=A0AAV7RQB1_PLEWA|nr:hypothetical protein NDU88_007439 [Pleurodeles waltl]
MPSKAWQKHITEDQRLTNRDTEKINVATEPELQVFPMLFYVMLHLGHQRRQRRLRVGEDTGDAWMDVVEVSPSEVYVLLGVVLLVVAVEAVHAGVSVDVTVTEMEDEEEGEAEQAVDVCATEEETGDDPVSAVDPEDSEDEEAEDEDEDNRTSVILQYFQ